MAGTSDIFDQDTAEDSRTKELQSVNTKLESMKNAVDSQSKDLQKINTKLESMKDAVDAVTAGLSKVEVGLIFHLIQNYAK